MADPFTHMANALTGTAPPALATPAEAVAARLGRAAAVLRAAGEPDLIAVAEGLDQWLAAGGDLRERLGVKARRGRRHDLPANAAAELAKRRAVHGLVQLLGLGDESPSVAGRALAALLASPTRGPLILRQLEPGVKLPSSESQLKRLLRSTE